MKIDTLMKNLSLKANLVSGRAAGGNNPHKCQLGSSSGEHEYLQEIKWQSRCFRVISV